MNSDDFTLMSYLEDALNSELGVKLDLESADDLPALRARFYKVKGTDVRYANLTLSDHSERSQLWIIKRDDS